MIHWLGIDDCCSGMKWGQLKWYVDHYHCETEIFIKTVGDLLHVIRLKCDQNYNDLNLEVNSWDPWSIFRYERKPRGLVKSPNSLDFYVNKYLTKEIEELEDYKDFISFLEEGRS